MANKGDALGDRMKSYEAQEAGRRFLPGLPVYARIDGRSFSRFTNGLKRPYDVAMSEAMVETTRFLVAHTHAKIGYTQSDEISLVWHQDDPKSEIFFDGRIQKMTSVLAALAATAFNRECDKREQLRERALSMMPVFDARVFQLPNRAEAANCFLWRELDATKNAISMATRAYYSARQMHGKSGSEMQEMLLRKGVNFNDYPTFFKRGTWLRRATFERPFTPAELDRIPAEHRPAPGDLVTRSEVRPVDMPVFSKVANREAVIFEGADPVLAAATERKSQAER